MTILDTSVAAEEVNDLVRDQLAILQRAMNTAADSYHKLMRQGNSLSDGFISDIGSAVGGFSMEQKQLLKHRASPKAAEMNVDPKDNISIANFLGRCFSDSNGHILSYRMYPYGIVNEERASEALWKAALSRQGLKAIQENFDLFLENVSEPKSNYLTLSAIYKDTIGSITESMGHLGTELGRTAEDLIAIKEKAFHDLNGRGSIAYIIPITPSEWHI